jgi:hypothetical protein
MRPQPGCVKVKTGAGVSSIRAGRFLGVPTMGRACRSHADRATLFVIARRIGERGYVG